MFCRGSKSLVMQAVATGLLLSAPAWATFIEYQVDPTQSSLSLSGDWNGRPLWSKQIGGLQTFYMGSIQADVTDASIQLLGADLMAAVGPGKQRPRGYGRARSQVADYSGFFRYSEPCLHGNLNVAFRDIALTMSSAPITLANGRFDAASIFVPTTTAAMDYAAAGALSCYVEPGRVGIARTEIANSPAEQGSLTAANGLERLIIPVRATFEATIDSCLPDAYDRFGLTLMGTIVASRITGLEPERPVPPEPSTLILLAAGLLVPASRRVGRR